MVQLNVIIVGTSPAETARLQEALQKTHALGRSRVMALDAAVNGSPHWDAWDLILARYREEDSAALFALLAPVLRQAAPPVFFLVDPFTPLLFVQLLNQGASRVIPLDFLEQSLAPSLASLFCAPAGDDDQAVNEARGPEDPCRGRQGKIDRLNPELERLVSLRTSALEAATRALEVEIDRRKGLEDFSKQLSQIIWETPDVVIVYGADWRVMYLNKAGRALLGLAENAPVNALNIFAAYPVEMRLRILDEIQPALLKEGIWRGETTFQRADGRVVPLSQVFLCQKDGDARVLYFATIARDVSEFIQVEQELRQSREHYRTLAEAAQDFIFVVSKDGQMEYANEYACRALNCEPDKVAGMPADQFFPAGFLANPLQSFRQLDQIDRPVYTEGPFNHGGQQVWLSTWLVPVYNDQAGLVSVLGISRDISEQKKTDEALQRALQNERKLGEMRSNFFSMTSHQFRTPLSTIMLSAELLLKYGQKWDDQKQAEHLHRIQDSAQRINLLLEDILVIGKVDSGRYACSPKAFDLVDFCERAIAEMMLNDRDGHEFIFQHEEPGCPIFQDPEVMHRVVDNLLSNAIKYSAKGTQVTLGIRMDGASVLMEVVDQGIGIPEEDLKFLFQPFQRGSNAGDIPGTGIGLTIIQKSVELMDGSITLQSKEGQGTTFQIRFPAQYQR